MRIGTEIFRELIKKMLSVHIATIERKMRACVQCPPRCPVPSPMQELKQNPYTRTFKKLPFIPRKMLSTYVTNRLNKLDRLNKKRITLEEEKKVRRQFELKEKQLKEWNGRIDKAEEETQHRKLMVQAQIRALQGDAAQLADLRKVAPAENKEEYDLAVVQAREDIRQILAGDQDQLKSDLEEVASRVRETGPIPADLFKDVPEDLHEQTPTVEVSSGTQDEVPAVPAVPADAIEIQSDLQIIADADAAHAETGIGEFAVAAIAGIAEPETEPEAAPEGGKEDEKQDGIPNNADNLAALIAGRLASVTGTDRERRAKRQKWRKSPGQFWGKREGGWPGPGVIPDWAKIIYSGKYNRRKKFIEDLLKGRSGIDKAEAWVPIIKKLFAEPQHAWILAQAVAQAEEEEEAPGPPAEQAAIDEYFPPLPGGLTAADSSLLDKVYGERWKEDTVIHNTGRSVADFQQEGIPVSHFIKLAKMHRKAFRQVEGSKPDAQDYQPVFYEVCVQEGGPEIMTSDARNLDEFEQEVYEALGTEEANSKMMWKVPETIRNKDGWPGGSKEEIPVFYESIHHLYSPVWESAIRPSPEGNYVHISYGTKQHVFCKVPDLPGYGTIPIPVDQLREAIIADVTANPNVFGPEAIDDASSYHPESEASFYPPDPASTVYILTPSEIGDEDEGDDLSG